MGLGSCASRALRRRPRRRWPGEGVGRDAQGGGQRARGREGRGDHARLQAQSFFPWWLTTFLVVTCVQVLQAFCFAIGGWLVAQPEITGGAPSDAARDLLTAAVGAGVLLAAAGLPPRQAPLNGCAGIPFFSTGGLGRACQVPNVGGSGGGRRAQRSRFPMRTCRTCRRWGAPVSR